MNTISGSSKSTKQIKDETAGTAKSRGTEKDGGTPSFDFRTQLSAQARKSQKKK